MPSHAHIRSAKFSCATKNHGYTHTHHILCTTFLQLRSKKIHTIHSNNDNKVTAPTPTSTHACKVESQNTKNTFLRSHGYTYCTRALVASRTVTHARTHRHTCLTHIGPRNKKICHWHIGGNERKEKIAFFFFSFNLCAVVEK